MTTEDPRALLDRLETTARKRFGQHFLTQTGIVDRMVRGARVQPGDPVIEIGPGLGILTRALLRAGAQVTAIELDRDLAAFLREELPEITLIEGDAAKVDWPALVQPGTKVVANLPYNVGTTVVMQLLRTRGLFESVTVMLQKEVVDRLMAEPGTRAYGALTVETAALARPVYIMTIEPGAFHPPPKVRSSVLRLDLHPDGPHYGSVEPAFFDKVVRASFSQRRKTLVNSLGATFGKDQVREAILKLGLDERVRGERLDLKSFQGLAALLDVP